MKYYFDTEFREGFTSPIFGRPQHIIDLISIGIVAEDGKEYYAISKDFDIKAAWKAWQPRRGQGDRNNIEPRDYWLRHNVLKPIWKELEYKEYREDPNEVKHEYYEVLDKLPAKDRVDFYIDNMLGCSGVWLFSFSEFKRLVKKYGKSNKQIAGEIFDFVNPGLGYHSSGYSNSEFRNPDSPMSRHFDAHNVMEKYNHCFAQPEFWAYFADYDWVVFCSLWGRMLDLPVGFPKYCRDLKQILDETAETIQSRLTMPQMSPMVYRSDIKEWVKEAYETQDLKAAGQVEADEDINTFTFEQKLTLVKNLPGYPKHYNEHNALADANWNKNLHQFLKQII